MTDPTALADLSLSDLTRAVASASPVPGSGSVAAALGALGTGLASMALAARSGEEAPSESQAALERTRAELLARIDRDAAAYRSFLSARRGKGNVAEAAELSIRVPREVAELALDALEHLAAGLPRVRRQLSSECVTAGEALFAAVEGAVFTAGSNLETLADARRRAEHGAALATLRRRAHELHRTLRERLADPLPRP
jgi:formiminotetrahydrofolate cyclodeaminase